MSGKEPLLGALKVCILNFQESNSPYTDSCPHLQSFCEILEMILRKGLKQPVLGFKRKDYWHWLEQLPQQETHHSRTLLSMMIEKTSSCEKVLTAQGRGRYFLRLALNGKLLAVAVQQLIRTPRLLECYDPITSILSNEEFSEPFFSMMLVVTEMNFSLDLQNSSFLDESWQLPVCQTYETVPCRELGMVLRLLYNLRYIGQANVGKYGGKEILDVGIPMVLDKCLPQQEILFDVKETEVIVQHKTTSKVLFRYSYTDISCVGRRLDSNNFFAFCSLASPDSPEDSTFDCLVFESNSEEESEEIIKRIAAGFKHTEWFV
ncbi:uncharacterized protein LOC120301151 isoform X4 [Crotalus tigris]|uniref:uncharacterized protein LOC120301151 isoform X4 n=1 Tax=Crotalus tigris TaxID=88082 RepID=UPI00192F4033|nr:uncharacterized protein LOC120301151 isoform X4 [Crotalus tigris]